MGVDNVYTLRLNQLDSESALLVGGMIQHRLEYPSLLFDIFALVDELQSYSNTTH